MKNIIKVIEIIEDALIILLLASLIFISMSQIVLRNILEDGLIWAEPMLRICVLWLGLIGAMVATRHKKQIKIDILNKFLGKKYESVIQKVNYLFPAIICIIAAYYSFEFTVLEYSYGSYAFDKFPSWLAVSIIPVAFLIMSIRYMVYLFVEARSLVSEQ